MNAATREMLFHCILRGFLYFGNFFDRVTLHIEKQDRSSFFCRYFIHSLIKILICKGGIRLFMGGNVISVFIPDSEPFSALVIDKRIVAYFENPGVELLRI